MRPRERPDRRCRLPGVAFVLVSPACLKLPKCDKANPKCSHKYTGNSSLKNTQAKIRRKTCDTDLNVHAFVCVRMFECMSTNVYVYV